MRKSIHRTTQARLPLYQNRGDVERDDNNELVADTAVEPAPVAASHVWRIKYYAGWLGWSSPQFKPCVIDYPDLGLTEMILEDTCIVWQPWNQYEGHAVDLGYSTDGRLVGIKIWDSVATKKERPK
jgi:hypothetical protein